MTIVMLDSGPLGLATHPRPGVEAVACQQWVTRLVSEDVRLMVPEIADCEVRRELIRARRKRGLILLDEFSRRTEYIAITTVAMRLAAELWADVRRHGRPTSADDRLEADAILAAQAMTLQLPNIVVATTNVKHLARFCDAALWSEIEPD